MGYYPSRSWLNIQYSISHYLQRGFSFYNSHASFLWWAGLDCHQQSYEPIGKAQSFLLTSGRQGMATWSKGMDTTGVTSPSHFVVGLISLQKGSRFGPFTQIASQYQFSTSQHEHERLDGTWKSSPFIKENHLPKLHFLVPCKFSRAYPKKYCFTSESVLLLVHLRHECIQTFSVGWDQWQQRNKRKKHRIAFAGFRKIMFTKRISDLGLKSCLEIGKPRKWSQSKMTWGKEQVLIPITKEETSTSHHRFCTKLAEEASSLRLNYPAKIMVHPCQSGTNTRNCVGCRMQFRQKNKQI